jgi:hypothetical protein
MTKAYEDELWLTNVNPLVSLEETEAFIERVAIKVADGTSEVTARREAYVEIIESGKIKKITL